ncbi:restriction endonuclease [Cryobacterium gelidum]|uniref:site-specific DNA-methyltransferase (adenine-specific) n=2 Tax=Cryobacterium gelidum TaxID=1259164 RepID=A0A4R9ASZ8_9MICO|nr:restriction endonuclease [Cryobacterium gelidum]
MLRRDRQNRAPDVLNTIASLSSDEIFTPPEFANKMLETLTEAWAANFAGASIWANPNVTFLDPATKSGIFLREITRRLVEGQGNPPEGSDERKALVDRVLTKQVFGLGMTTLTSLLARRSIYCSKDATSRHSVAPSSLSRNGNVWFERTEHTWSKGTPIRTVDPISGDELLTYPSCTACGAGRKVSVDGIIRRFDDPAGETHAYAFIHADDSQEFVQDIFGAEMQFDVIIGNPPYQMTGAGGGTNDAPIYQKFIDRAKALHPRFLSMVTPSRWMAGGRGLAAFRAEMLGDRRLRNLVDYPSSVEAFPGVDVAGGISYFLWDQAHDGPAEVTTVRGGSSVTSMRVLDEFDVFVRDAVAVEILHKVRAGGEASITSIMAGDTPFGIATNFDGFHTLEKPGDIALHYNRKGSRLIGYVSRGSIRKNAHWIDTWKILIPEAGFEHGGGDGRSMRVLSTPLIASSPSVCTQTYLFFHVGSEAQAVSVETYISTRLFRFLVSLRKITQHASRDTYSWVPLQSWDRTWTDADLYAKYKLTSDEIDYIESVIKPINVGAKGEA